jgi:ankyrin repeat protein
LHAAAGPISEDAEREYLRALTQGDAGDVARLERELPGLPGHSVATACAAGEVDGLRAFIAGDGSLAEASHGPNDWPALAYVATSRLAQIAPDRAEDLLDCARSLLDAGADPNATYRSEAWTVPVLYPPCGVTNNPELARLLLQRGANPNDGESVYHAAESAYFECLEVLLEHGADPGVRSETWGNTPLYFLTGYRETDGGAAAALEGMRWLLEHGADPNVRCTANEETALHGCARSARGVAALALLVSHGADPLIRARDGRSAYALARIYGHMAIAEWLAQHGGATELSPADRFLAACADGDEAEARAAMAAVPDAIGRFGPQELRLLSEAAARDATDAVRVMLELGWPIDAPGMAGGSALHVAAWFGCAPTLRLLVERGSPLELRDPTYGSTPLGWAAYGAANCRRPGGDYLECVRALLEAGASVRGPMSKDGRTALEMASGAPEVQEAMRAFGAR